MTDSEVIDLLAAALDAWKRWNAVRTLVALDNVRAYADFARTDDKLELDPVEYVVYLRERANAATTAADAALARRAA